MALWEELGRQLLGIDWQTLEAAIELVREAFQPGSRAPIAGALGELIAARFAADCRTVIEAGGALFVWMTIADDKAPCSALPDDAGEKGPEAADRLVLAAECWALVVGSMTRAQDDRDALVGLFGGGAVELDDFAPFAVDHDPDRYAERVERAAGVLICERNIAAKLEALADYALGTTAAAEARRPSSVERMGLVAWAARAIVAPRSARRAAPSRARVLEVASVG